MFYHLTNSKYVIHLFVSDETEKYSNQPFRFTLLLVIGIIYTFLFIYCNSLVNNYFNELYYFCRDYIINLTYP